VQARSAALKTMLAGLAGRLYLARPAEPRHDHAARDGRPTFASVIAVIMVLTGLIAYSLLPVAQFPDITPIYGVILIFPLPRFEPTKLARRANNCVLDRAI
jgi:hypothetical protein